MAIVPPYTVTTKDSHTPTWSGILDRDGGGNWNFTPTDGNTVPVNLATGVDPDGEWIQFTNTQAQPHAVHYQKAHNIPNTNKFTGPANNNSGLPGDTDDWTATPQTPEQGKY